MEFGYTRTAIILVLCIYFVHSVAALPRTVPKPEDAVAEFPDKSFGKTTVKPVTRVKIPSRVSCDYEDATEDEVCMKHCMPKGYTYGVCVSKTCTCI